MSMDALKNRFTKETLFGQQKFVDQNGSSMQSPILRYEVLKTEHRKDIVEEIE